MGFVLPTIKHAMGRVRPTGGHQISGIWIHLCRLTIREASFHPKHLRLRFVSMTFDRITFDPAIMGGRACIRGMRIPVSVIVGQLAHGATTEEVLKDYPDLDREDVQQALEYAAWLAQEEVVTV
jgi:uncharacterized protein (DUF433 family)